MGWIYSPQAGRTMNAIEAVCRMTREPHHDKSDNVFYVNGRRYFYELRERTLIDRGIVGLIFLSMPDNKCRSIGRFRIAGNGEVIRGPALFKHAKPVKEGRWNP